MGAFVCRLKQLSKVLANDVSGELLSDWQEISFEAVAKHPGCKITGYADLGTQLLYKNCDGPSLGGFHPNFPSGLRSKERINTLLMRLFDPDGTLARFGRAEPKAGVAQI